MIPNSNNDSISFRNASLKDGGIRIVCDFRRLNTVTVAEPFLTPTIDSTIARVGNSTYLSKLDILKGFTKSLWRRNPNNILPLGVHMANSSRPAFNCSCRGFWLNVRNLHFLTLMTSSFIPPHSLIISPHQHLTAEIGRQWAHSQKQQMFMVLHSI